MRQAVRLAFIKSWGREASAPSIFMSWRLHRSAFLILVVFVLAVLSVPRHDLTAVLLFAAVPLLFVTALRLSIRLILARLALLSPFILIMAVANPLLDRSPFIAIGALSLSGGMVSGTVIVAKSVVTITAVIAFSLCVPFYRICELLRGFLVPEVFVTQLLLLYRYAVLLVDEAMAMHTARNLRSFGRRGRDLATTAKLIGALLVRTIDKARRIYRAMVARGFSGELTRRRREPVRAGEILLVSGAIILFGAVRIIF